MSKTPIEWTERTWNPVRGCSPVSPGCAHCYAERHGGRFCGPGRPFDGFVQLGKNGQPGPHWTGKVELVEHMLNVPYSVRKPTTWFVNSMSDLFHEGLPFESIDRVMTAMIAANWHTYQILTKRSKRMREYFASKRGHFTCEYQQNPTKSVSRLLPFENVWLGVSVEDRERMFRIEDLRQTPAEVRFLSIEPLLEDLGKLDLRGIDWVIVGGESGPGARPFDIRWARSIVRQCQDAGVACFVKQLGADPREGNANGNCRNVNCTHPDCGRIRHRFKDRKGGDMDEWPGDLRVRQMPAVVERPRFVR